MALELAAGQLTLRAMSLVYSTLLSLVPLLAVSFSVLKGLGVHNQFEPVLLKLLEPMGDKGVEVSERVMVFVENIRAGVLGTLGLGFLLYVVISMIQKIESAFNYTWRVSSHRSLSQRFSNYLSVILVGPVLIVAALGITATVSHDAAVERILNLEVLGPLVEFAGRALPYLIIIAAFTFVYVFVPNTRVKLGSALVGAVVAGVLWESVGWAFTSFVANSANYTAIYSAFATLILFMIWLFLAWLILLIGASIAFFHQNPAYLTRRGHEPRLSIAQRERCSLVLLYLLARRFNDGVGPWNDDDLARELLLPASVIRELLQPLLEAGFLTLVTGSAGEGYQPAKPLGRIVLAEVIERVRHAGEQRPTVTGGSALQPVDALCADLADASLKHLDGATLEQLLQQPPAAVAGVMGVSARVG